MANSSRRWRALYLILGLFVAVSAAVWNYHSVSTTVRWLLWSRFYKSKVLLQSASASGGLKHIEWDGWGWAGMDTTVFLVFDPTDSLATAARTNQSGKFDGIPCEVFRVRRLEKEWYTVQFYTGEDWDRCN